MPIISVRGSDDKTGFLTLAKIFAEELGGVQGYVRLAPLDDRTGIGIVVKPNPDDEHLAVVRMPIEQARELRDVLTKMIDEHYTRGEIGAIR